MSIASTLNSLASNASAANSSASTGKKKNLEASDFINMMITQLQNQDPTEPTKSSDLLAQMSQIGSLQSSTDLQASLKKMTLQNSVSNAASMIGKTVAGKDVDGTDMDGIVTSVKVVDGAISLQLDSGKSMSMDNVVSVMPTTDKAPATPTN
jgi:flagellar basal-body rod modification protein FlgD